MTTIIDGTTGIDKVVDGSIGTNDLANGAVTADKLGDGALIENTANGIGYGTGAGSVVTQLTSKSTAVTLNKPTGQITMMADALAAGAFVYFTVNNSLVTVNDTIIVNGASFGVDPINYRVEIARVTSSAFTLRVTNVSAGSLSEAIRINFAIIKGSAS